MGADRATAPAAVPRWRRARERWDRFTTPTPLNLPNAGVLAAGLGLLAAVFVVLVATGVNGTSSGAFHAMVSTGADPALLFGQPNLIRTDEWNVQTVWAIAQFQQGLPAINETFPGGMDPTVPQDLPRVDWSVAFRPHLWGFMLFDVGHGQAWKWWLPVFGLAAAAYTFALTLMPRRVLTALTLGIAFTASPFFAWWLLQTTLWPAAWGFAVLAATVWILRTTSRVAVVVWAVLVGYLTVVMAMGIYVPFIIPIVIVVAAVVVGLGLEARRDVGWRPVLRRLGVLVLAGATAGVVLGVWLVTRWHTVTEFLSTAYPGERLEATGRGAHAVAGAALFGSSFTNSLRNAGTFLDGNASESATFFLPGVFLGAVVLWFAIVQRRRGRGVPWALVLGYVALLVLLAFIFVPGWDALSHLLLLDRSTGTRVRIGLGFGSMVILVMLLARITKETRPGWAVSLVGPAVFVASQVAIAVALHRLAPQLLAASGIWWAYAAVGGVVILAAARGWRSVAAIGMLVISVVATYGINPLYVGVFDLRSTAPAQAVAEIDATAPGAWVGIGDALPTAILLESGATAYNGFQGAPIDEMWAQIDPDQRFEYEWNRLAGISWTPGEGDPVVSNPYPDQIRVTFDACARFAQENVRYVLSDVEGVGGPCLTPLRSFDLPSGPLSIWEVVPAG
ncbi:MULTISPECIES: DUF7657 domain-containing protein [unclassified Microbacterium]|uniref:DUF7657 domain-containing protein n=1 Tax=unclassified Microbacterium TaxID=2609290 RepID=UPI003016C4C8